MIRVAKLVRDVPTRIGIFPTGLRVLVLKRGTIRSRVCLDPIGAHLTGCHSVSVPTRFITPQRLVRSGVAA